MASRVTRITTAAPHIAERLWNRTLYALVDTSCCADPVATGRALAEAGVGLLQLRAKDASVPEYTQLAREMMHALAHTQAIFVVNDHITVAAEIECSRRTCWPDDASPAEAKRLLGADTIVGLSTHTPRQVSEAQSDPHVDYIGMGPMYPTSTKPHEPVQVRNC